VSGQVVEETVTIPRATYDAMRDSVDKANEFRRETDDRVRSLTVLIQDLADLIEEQLVL